MIQIPKKKRFRNYGTTKLLLDKPLQAVLVDELSKGNGNL
jgi:hypothetical protein